MATINLTQLKKEKEAKPASSFNNAPTIVLNKGKSSVETLRTNYDFSDRTAEPVQRKTLQTPVVTAPQTTTVNQQINRPAQQDQYGLWDNAGYVVEQAGKGLQGGIGGLVNAASTFLDKPLQTVNAIGSFGSKFSTSNDYSQYDPATAEALRQKDAEIEQLRRQMYGNLDENFLDPIAQKGVELGAEMIAKSQESNYDRDKLSGVGRFTGDVAKAVTGMAPSLAVGAVAGPGAGLAVMGTGAYGQSLQQALNDGASYDDAVVYGLASAGVEIATEKLFGGIPFFGEGAVDDVLKEWMQAKLGTGTGKKVVEYLVESVGEGAEEYISEVAGEFLVDIYTDERKDKDFFDRLMDVQDDAFYSFLLGAVTGGVMGAPGTILQSIKSGKTQEQSAEAQTTPTEKDPMKAMINEDAKAEAQKIVADMGQSTPVNDYVAEGLKSDNVAVKMEAQKKNAENIRKSAKKLNIDKQVEEIIQVSNKLGKTIEFTEDLVDQKAWGANTGEKIILSKKSGDMIQQIFVHELTHDAENSQLYSELETELSNLAAVNGVDVTALTEQIIRDYAEQGVSLDDVGARAEVNARIAQEYLFKESGIKQLANTNLSLAQKVFDWVRSLRIKLSGTEAEKQLLKTEQLYKKAISETSKTSKTQYSIENAEFREENGVVIFNGNNFRNVINNSERSLSSELRTYLKRKYSGKYIYVGKLYDAYFNGTSATEYSYPANRNTQADFPYMENKANIAVDLNKLVENARFIGNDPDDGRHERAIGGWDNFKVTFGVERDGNVDYFEGVIKVMITDRGPLFYDITKIKRSRGLQGSNAPSSTSNNSISDSSENNNTQYSISDKNILRRKDLMSVHNLSETKLKKSLELGGMPYPSIAVTKDTVGHENFGEVSLVFNEDTINPRKSKSNKVYSRDAWTPTFPQIDQKINRKEFVEANHLLDELSQRVDEHFKSDVRNFLNKWDKSDTPDTFYNLWDYASRSVALKAAFLEDTGKHIEMERKTIDERDQFSERDQDFLVQLWWEYKEAGADIEQLSAKQVVDRYGYEPAIKAVAYEMNKYDFVPKNKAEEKANTTPRFILSGKIKKAKDMFRVFSKEYAGKIEQNVNKLVDDVNSSVDMKAYESWVKDKFSNIFGESGIRNDKSLYAANGNIRNFEQLHDEYNLDNVIRHMKKQDSSANVFFGAGLNTMMAARAEKFSSIEDIIAREDVLTQKDELFKEKHKMFEEQYDSFQKEAYDFYEYPNTDAYSKIQDFASATVDAARIKRPTVSSVKTAFSKHDFNVTDDFASRFAEFCVATDELTTSYFEAKPERAVGFDEVNAAVIPNTLSEDIKQMLRERGVNMVEYDPSVEGDRQRVMNSLEDVKFAIGDSIMEKAKDPVVRARAIMEKRIRGTFLFDSKADPRKMYEITSRLEHEFNQTGKISAESRKELFNAAYNETLKNADITYKELPEFKQMISEDLNRAVTQYENTLIKERELLKFAQENDIDISEVKLNPTFGFLKNVKPEDLPDKIISYKKLKASLKSDLIGEVGGKYAGGKQIDSLIDQAAKEILEYGYIASTTKFKIHQEMVENGYTLNDERMIENKELYDRIKETKLLVPRGFNREIQDYDQTKKVLKTSTLEGRDIGDFYNSLNEDYGEQFPADIINPAQQYEKIYEVISALEPEIVWYEQSAERNAEIRQYLEDTFTDRLEDFKNQVVYRSQKDYYDRAAKKQVAQDSALNQISDAISEKFFKDNKEIDELKKTEDVIKSKVSIDELAQVVAKIRDRGALSKTLAQNLDAMAGGDVVLRAQLAEIFEKPLREAKRNYVTNQKRVLDDVYQSITQDLGIKMGSKESSAMMWYGEGKRQLNKVKGKVESDKLELTQYTLDDLKKDFPDTWKNIVEADRIMRKYYDEYVDRINQSLERIYSERNLRETVNERRTELQKEIREAMERLEQYKSQRQGEVGTPDIEARINAQRKRISDLSKQFNNVAEDVYRNKRLNKRSDYYHHFQEIGMVESIQEILKGDSANNISNALAGISENTKPKSKWSSFMQKRSDAARYEEDAIKGFLKYAPAAEYKIAFDPYVAQMRGTIQDIIKLSDEANINNAKAIKWLTNYTNALAGKTNPLDRWVANTQSGREILQLLNKVNSKVKANAVAGNLNSAVSQFYNLPNGIAVLTDNGGVKAQIDLAKGSKDYAAYAAKKVAGQDVSDNPINHSVFLAERYIDSTLDRFDESILHKPQQAATFMLTFGDQVVAEQLWFSAYNQAQRLGKTDAVAYADDLVARAVGGRGIGEVPLAQQSQVVKLIAPFQVEVNNAWQLMKQMGAGALKDKNKALGMLLMYAVTWLMNEINQAITGNRVGMDIFSAIDDSAKNWNPEKNVVTNSFAAAGRVSGEILSNVPMGAQLAQMIVTDEYDREKLFGEADPSRYGTGNIGINAIADPLSQLATGQNVDWQSLVTNFVTPYGGKQLNRLYKLAEDTGLIPRVDFNTEDLLQVSKKPGAYNDKGQLKYQIDTTDPLNIAKGLAFGTYATKEGKEYIENEYNALSDNQTKIYEAAAENGADLNYLYKAMRELPNIKSLKNDEGKTVTNSQSALSRLYLEKMGLYDDVVEGLTNSGADPVGVKLSKTVIEMTEADFKEFLKELEKYRKE